MKLKLVVFALIIWLFYFLLIEVASIANNGENFIDDEEKRGVLIDDLNKSTILKRDIVKSRQHHPYPSSSSYGSSGSGYGSTSFGYPYRPPSYSNHEFSSSGYGHSGYGHSGVGGGHHSAEGNSGYHHNYDKKALAIKTLLIPLAGIALLGAAAALSTNPVLLQLGVVNGRRKKRDLEDYNKFYPYVTQLND